MRIKTKINGRPEGSICEWFVYTSYLVAYPNSSDMNELAEIPHAALRIFKRVSYMNTIEDV